MKIVIGLVLGLAIGAACRWFDIPSPGPPRLMGALLVVAMTLGYIRAKTLAPRDSPTEAKPLTHNYAEGRPDCRIRRRT